MEGKEIADELKQNKLKSLNCMFKMARKSKKSNKDIVGKPFIQSKDKNLQSNLITMPPAGTKVKWHSNKSDKVKRIYYRINDTINPTNYNTYNVIERCHNKYISIQFCWE